jgi:ornithine carbamoyltransferase
LRVATPKQLALPPELVRWARDEKADIHITSSAEAAAKDATCVVTDAWVSMHDKDVASRHNLLKPFQVDAALMKKAAKHAIFMHCLPAHRGEEVTAEVIDGPQSVVFDEAENRLHAQKAILLHCLEQR